MTLPLNHCGSCALRSQDGEHCLLTNGKINPKEDYCSKHMLSPKICEICGRFIIPNAILDPDEDNTYHTICAECCSKMGFCPTCDCSRSCAFETDSAAIPKVITKNIRQGNMVMQAQVKNPERIAATCAKGCSCWNGNKCCRENNQCEKYKHNYT